MLTAMTMSLVGDMLEVQDSPESIVQFPVCLECLGNE